MNILIISHLYYPKVGGVEIAVANLCEQFTQKGHRVEIVTTHLPNTVPKVEFIKGVKVTRLPFRIPIYNPTSLLKFIWRAFECVIKLLLIAKKKNFDVINLHYAGENALYALLTSCIKKIPLVTSIHGSDIEYFASNGRFNKWIVKKTLNSSIKIIANSTALLQVTSSIFGRALLSKATVIGNGVNIDLLEHMHHTENNDIVPDSYILGIGRLEYFKGFDILIEAFSIIKRENPNLKLIIVGDGPERNSLEDISKKIDLNNSVIFYGRLEQTDVFDILKNCLFFVMCSRREAFGIVLLEAMAMGKAVIAVDTGGVSELVHDGVNGVLLKENKPISIANAANFLLKNPEMAKKYGEKGKQMVFSNYSWEIISNKYLDVLQSALSL